MTKISCKHIDPIWLPGTHVQAELMNIRALHAHRHENGIEFLYCLDGHVWGHIAHNQYSLHAGDLITFDLDDIHNAFSAEDNICLIVHLDLVHPDYRPDEMRNTLFSCTTDPQFLRHPESTQLVCDLLLAIMLTASQNTSNSLLCCEKIRERLLELMMQKFSWFSIQGWDDEYSKYTDRFQMIINYIADHFQEKITLQQLSEMIYLNPSYISNFMRRTTFGSITEAVAYYRCFYGQKLLLETDLPVGSISSLCGFSSDKYFYRWFKYFWGTSPLQHKKCYAAYQRQPETFMLFSPPDAISILEKYMLQRQVSKAMQPISFVMMD